DGVRAGHVTGVQTCALPISCAASHSPRIKVFRNAQRRGKTECGGWDFPLRASRARLLNPWTPARPDLKSGAVVQAWLPPHAAHRAIGIMPFCVRFPARSPL